MEDGKCTTSVDTLSVATAEQQTMCMCKIYIHACHAPSILLRKLYSGTTVPEISCVNQEAIKLVSTLRPLNDELECKES